MSPALSRVLPLVLLATGCAQGPSGIWLLEVPWQDGSACDDAITENFLEAYVPGESTGAPSEWTFGDDYKGADSISFVQIETYGDGSAVLVVGATPYPGVQEGDDWVFSFQSAVSDAEWADHESGYGWKVTSNQSSDTTFTFTMGDGDTAAVEVEGESTAVTLWQESDEWSVDDVGVGSHFSFDDYLVYDDPDFGAEPQDNDYDVDDCEGGVCELRFSTTCASSGEYTATRTDYDNSDYYDYLNGVAQ
jgi:hypothetical protein